MKLLVNRQKKQSLFKVGDNKQILGKMNFKEREVKMIYSKT